MKLPDPRGSLNNYVAWEQTLSKARPYGLAWPIVDLTSTVLVLLNGEVRCVLQFERGKVVTESES